MYKKPLGIAFLALLSLATVGCEQEEEGKCVEKVEDIEHNYSTHCNHSAHHLVLIKEKKTKKNQRIKMMQRKGSGFVHVLAHQYAVIHQMTLLTWYQKILYRMK